MIGASILDGAASTGEDDIKGTSVLTDLTPPLRVPGNGNELSCQARITQADVFEGSDRKPVPETARVPSEQLVTCTAGST
jgi:hypothetical protein